MKAFMLLPSLLFGTVMVSGQRYTTAIGLRLSADPGITLQQRIGKRFTIEGLVQQNLQEPRTTVSALLQRHIGLLPRKGLNVYGGLGPHMGFVSRTSSKGLRQTDIYGGLSLIAGAEVALRRMVFSLDYKPVVNVGGGAGLIQAQTGISVRYILAKAPEKERNLKGLWHNKKRGGTRNGQGKKTVQDTWLKRRA